MDAIMDNSQEESNCSIQKHLKFTNTTPDKQLMMFFSNQEFFRNQAQNQYYAEAVNSGTAFYQK